MLQTTGVWDRVQEDVGNTLSGWGQGITKAVTGQNPEQAAKSWGGFAASTYLPLAALTGVGVGAALYDHTKARDTNALIAQKARQRAARRAATAPVEAFAVPVTPATAA